MRENQDGQMAGIEIDLQELLRIYLKKWWLIALCLVITGAAAFAYTYFLVTPQYRASVSIYVNNRRDGQQTDSLSNADVAAADRLANTYMNITTSDRVLTKVVQLLDNTYTAAQIAGFITTEKLEETLFFRVHVTHADPEEAARIANAVATVATTEIAVIIEGTSAQIIDTASVPASPFSPGYIKIGILGACVGALAVIVYLTIVHLMDTRIRDEDDLAALFDFSILGRIPDLKKTDVGGTGAYNYVASRSQKENM